MTCTVVNKYKDEYDVYIGRGSLFGNPFPINESIGDTREIVIEKFKRYLWECLKDGTISVQMLKELDNKRLGCFCKPKACHGDVIASAVEWALQQS